MAPRPSSTLLVASLLLFSSLASRISAQGQACGLGIAACTASAPCCSEYGFCGSTGTFCLGGCNPLHSNTPQSCSPAPLCLPNTYIFKDLSRIQQNVTAYNGNATAYDFVVDKGTVLSTGSEAVLTLTADNGGTKISSTRYVHYGTITARLKTSSAAGVVTAFITMSDVKDEIDVEMPGTQTTEFQTNYFWLGVADYSSGVSSTISGLEDTHNVYHDYTIDWQPDQIQWSVDGNVTTTITKTSTLSGDGSQYKYPSTPSRVQLSIWPAGISSSAQGTIDWAGGMIDYTTPEFVDQGYYAVQLESIAVTCSPSQADLVNTTSQSYVYALTNDTSNIPHVSVSSLSTVLGAAGKSTSPSMKTAALVAALMGTFAIFI